MDPTKITAREADALIAETVMDQPRPDEEQTACSVRGIGFSCIRGWELARHSGKPVDDIASFYWRPPSYCNSPIESKRLREKLQEHGHVDLRRWWHGNVDCRLKLASSGFVPRNGKTFRGVHADECLAVVLCALRFAGVQNPEIAHD